MTNQNNQPLPRWITIALPVVALGLMVVLFALGNPLALFTRDLPPLENLTFEQVRVSAAGFEITLINGGPDPVTVSQVLVDEAYWAFEMPAGNTIPRLGRAQLNIPYRWVEYEAYEITLITSTGVTFSTEVSLAIPSPTFGPREFSAYGLIGVYVGIIPVALGMLWFPAMRQMGRKWLGALMALTIGLLVFLMIDTLLEALETAEQLPAAFQSTALVLLTALLTWLVLQAVGALRQNRDAPGARNPGLYLAGMIAFGIGLHNLGEGLAIGAAFATGEAALGSFLVIGFMLHNVTEGIGIVTPLLPRQQDGGESDQRSWKPGLRTFTWLALLAGAPAILGAWIGGFAFSPILASLFLGIGVGAIWQVIVEVTNLLRRFAAQEGTSPFNWPNLAGFAAGILVMYLTAFLT